MPLCASAMIAGASLCSQSVLRRSVASGGSLASRCRAIADRDDERTALALHTLLVGIGKIERCAGVAWHERVAKFATALDRAQCARRFHQHAREHVAVLVGCLGAGTVTREQRQVDSEYRHDHLVHGLVRVHPRAARGGRTWQVQCLVDAGQRDLSAGQVHDCAWSDRRINADRVEARRLERQSMIMRARFESGAHARESQPFRQQCVSRPGDLLLLGAAAAAAGRHIDATIVDTTFDARLAARQTRHAEERQRFAVGRFDAGFLAPKRELDAGALQGEIERLAGHDALAIRALLDIARGFVGTDLASIEQDRVPHLRGQSGARDQRREQRQQQPRTRSGHVTAVPCMHGVVVRAGGRCGASGPSSCQTPSRNISSGRKRAL